MSTVLVVEDQEPARCRLRAELELHDFCVVEASDGEDAWQRFCQQPPDVVLTDLSVPRCDGLELLRRIRSRSDVPVILFSESGSIRTAAEAFKAGADDFVELVEGELDELVGRVRSSTRLEASGTLAGMEERLVGTSEAIGRVRAQLAGLASLSTAVLLRGEPGSGRSLAAACLHELGSTARGRLRVFDAASFVPADFADSGSIGAVQLQNVEQLPEAGQRYWLRRLEREERSGLAPSLRLLATTAVPLADRAAVGRFDPALSRALQRFEVEMPPLRDRAEDVPAIARSLLARIGRSMGRPRVQLSPAALAYLETCRLPANVAQLERLLEKAVAYSLNRVIRRRTVQELMVELERSVAVMREDHRQRERERLLQALEATGGNITHTARRLGRSRAAVYRLIAKYDIPLERSGPSSRVRPARDGLRGAQTPEQAGAERPPATPARARRARPRRRTASGSTATGSERTE